jgi:hypothetical protein
MDPRKWNKPSILSLIALFVLIYLSGKAWSGNSSSSTVTPRSITTAVDLNVTQPVQSMKALELPPNGETHYYQQAEAIAPFGISTAPNTNYFIKLVEKTTGNVALTIFVRGGQSVNIKVPLGSYEFRYASGTNWYGEEQLFGSRTVYTKANTIFDFYRNGPQIMGHTVKLIKQVDGNLQTREINKTDF